MTIHSGDWHFRLVRAFYYEYTPVNLCQYFWTVMSCLVWSLGLPLYLIGVGIEKFFNFIYDKMEEGKNHHGTGGIAARVAFGLISPLVLVAIPFVAFVLVLVILGVVTKERINKQFAKPSMTWEFIKARKNKVCPLIKVV